MGGLGAGEDIGAADFRAHLVGIEASLCYRRTFYVGIQFLYPMDPES